MTTPEFEEDLKYFESLVKAVRAYPTGKNITLVWKTMNPGHVGCSPVSNTPLNDHWSHRQNHTDMYNWFIFPYLDSYAKRVATKIGVKVVDMSPLYYRQDAHSDCLHYCMPGPVDLYSILLLNMLYNEEV